MNEMNGVLGHICAHVHVHLRLNRCLWFLTKFYEEPFESADHDSFPLFFMNMSNSSSCKWKSCLFISA